MRPWHIWLAFGICSAVVFAAMAWISWTVLRLEHAMLGQARLEENVRLALWRMDSSVAPLVAQESARPYFTYNAFYSTERAYTKMFAEIEKGEVLVPSPLLTQPVPSILIHFQVAPDGTFSSPQVPSGNMRDLAESVYTGHEKITEASRRLAEVAALLRDHELLRGLETGKAGASSTVVSSRRSGARGSSGEARWIPQSASQKVRSAQERAARAQSYQQAEVLGNAANLASGRGTEMRGEGMKPLWVDQVLLLTRKVTVEGRSYVQGCRLDWSRIRGELLDSIRDLLPEARLGTADLQATDDDERRLATLPVRLVAGAIPVEPIPLSSPIRLTMFAAWGCALLAAVAVAVLLQGVISLSERRRVFVSAVTHELRTPLTTFRLYTDMLADGMVRSEEKRKDYLVRLRGEAERLGHLVENVLFYARLESGRTGRVSEKVSLLDIVERVKERLAERTRATGMRLSIEADESSPVEVRVDCSALEQVLVNLIDNACKYAKPSSDPTIHLRLEGAGSRAVITVRDHGPGISRADQRRLFRPFSKSDREAANTAPGVGLGLALSRLLARAIGGDLRLDDDVEDGASFVLTLPIAG